MNKRNANGRFNIYLYIQESIGRAELVNMTKVISIVSTGFGEQALSHIGVSINW